MFGISGDEPPDHCVGSRFDYACGNRISEDNPAGEAVGTREHAARVVAIRWWGDTAFCRHGSRGIADFVRYRGIPFSPVHFRRQGVSMAGEPYASGA